MENILKKSSGKMERFVLAYAIVVVMVFGVLNPLTYVTDFNTAQEISGMGKAVNMDTKALPYGKVCSSESRQKISMLTMEKNILDKRDDSDLVSGIIEQPIVYPITDNENVVEEPVYIEISGMKIDSEGYVTEILSGAPDGVLAFPTDIRCKGIRSDVFERSDSSLKNETEEVYIPANIVHMDDGLFDCLENVDFIQVANGNPAYYSEFGILYHADGRLACMPQARICK